MQQTQTPSPSRPKIADPVYKAETQHGLRNLFRIGLAIFIVTMIGYGFYWNAHEGKVAPTVAADADQNASPARSTEPAAQSEQPKN